MKQGYILTHSCLFLYLLEDIVQRLNPLASFFWSIRPKRPCPTIAQIQRQANMLAPEMTCESVVAATSHQ